MPKSITKQKGHRFEKVRYHLPYYSSSFFEPNKETTEEGEVASVPTVQLPIKISLDGGEARSNVTHFKIKGITHFDNNVENVLESLSQLKERVIKPKGIADPNEEWKTTLQLLQIICQSGNANQTLQEATRIARTHIYENFVADNEDEVEEEILTGDDGAMFDYMEREFDDLSEDYDDTAAYTNHLFTEYKRSFWNHLNSVIFGQDAYRAFKTQKDYLLNKIIKPYGVPVEAAFRRVEVLCKYLEYFPPLGSRGKPTTDEQWEEFDEIKKIPTDVKREMKYNLLPDSFHDRFDELETDWSEMSSSKFLAEAQKFESADNKNRLKLEQQRAKLKRKKPEDNDSVSNLSRNQKERNATKLKKPKVVTPAGTARECELCKTAGAPEQVYRSHYTNQCRKRAEYAQAMSGGAGERKKTVKEYKASEALLRKELKMAQAKAKKLSSRLSKRSKKNDASSISSVDSDLDVSH